MAVSKATFKKGREVAGSDTERETEVFLVEVTAASFSSPESALADALENARDRNDDLSGYVVWKTE